MKAKMLVLFLVVVCSGVAAAGYTEARNGLLRKSKIEIVSAFEIAINENVPNAAMRKMIYARVLQETGILKYRPKLQVYAPALDEIDRILRANDFSNVDSVMKSLSESLEIYKAPERLEELER